MSKSPRSPPRATRRPAKFGDEVGVARTTGDYRTLLSDPEIDAVHICTPNALHFPMAKAALEAGKHVLCEKPLAVSVAEGKKLVELAKKQNLANCTFHNLRFYPDGAADPPHARGRRAGRDLRRAGHLLAGLALLRHRLELAHRPEGQREVARHGGHRLALVRHDRARHRTAHHLGVRRSADLPQDAQAAQGFGRDLHGKAGQAGGLQRSHDRQRGLRRGADIRPTRFAPRLWP